MENRTQEAIELMQEIIELCHPVNRANGVLGIISGLVSDHIEDTSEARAEAAIHIDSIKRLFRSGAYIDPDARVDSRGTVKDYVAGMVDIPDARFLLYFGINKSSLEERAKQYKVEHQEKPKSVGTIIYAYRTCRDMIGMMLEGLGK